MLDMTLTLELAKRKERSPAIVQTVFLGVGLACLLLAPLFFYPVFLMKILCFALFACAFNLLLGYTGLLSFGHAAFFGGAACFTAHAVKGNGACRPNSASSSASSALPFSARSSASSRSAGKASISP